LDSQKFFLEKPLTQNPLYDMIYLTNQTTPSGGRKMTKVRIEGKAMEAVAIAAGFEKQSDGRWIQKDSEGYNELMVAYDPNNHDYDFVVVLWTEDGEFVESMSLYAFLRVFS